MKYPSQIKRKTGAYERDVDWKLQKMVKYSGKTQYEILTEAINEKWARFERRKYVDN